MLIQEIIFQCDVFIKIQLCDTVVIVSLFLKLQEKATPKTPHSGKKSGKENSSTPKPVATPKNTPKSTKKEDCKPITLTANTKATPPASSSKPGSTTKVFSAVKRVPTPMKVRVVATAPYCRDEDLHIILVSGPLPH